MLKERKEKEELLLQIEFIHKRNKELEKECSETTNKYLKLYDENDKLQEYIQSPAYPSSGTGAKVSKQYDDRLRKPESTMGSLILALCKVLTKKISMRQLKKQRYNMKQS